MGHTTVNLVDRLIEADRRSPKTILVVGDPMTDIYVRGRLEKCEDGCCKLLQEDCSIVPGGAHNAARTLDHWKVSVVYPFATYPGAVKTRFMVGDKCLFRHDDDSCKFDYTSVRNRVLTMMSGQYFDAVLISDYDKGVMTADFISQVTSLCNKRGIPCVADCKRAPEIYRGAILKCNDKYHLKWAPCSADVVTRGADNPIVSGVVTNWSLLPVKCTNHVGAGDCFAAHLTLALAYGFDLASAAVIAHAAGRTYVQARHNEPPWPSDIRADAESWDV